MEILGINVTLPMSESETLNYQAVIFIFPYFLKNLPFSIWPGQSASSNNAHSNSYLKKMCLSCHTNHYYTTAIASFLCLTPYVCPVRDPRA